MNTFRRKPCFLAALGGVLLSCAQNPVPLELQQAEDMVQESTGVAAAFQPYAEPLDVAAQRRSVEQGLSLEQALQLTLRQQQELQAELFEIGLAQADLVQAGLLTNPTLDLAVRFPGGGAGTLIDAFLGFELMDAWQLPAREEAAGFELEATVARIARRAGGRLATTREAYMRAVAAGMANALAAEDSSLAAQMADQVAALEGFGFADLTMVADARQEALASENRSRQAAAQEMESLRSLARAMSLQVPVEALLLTDSLPSQVDVDEDVEALVDAALEHRLDLEALVGMVAALEAEVLAQERASLGGLRLGPNMEDPGDGDASFGPGLGWTIPLFDRNQAGIAKAAFALEQARHQLAGAQARVAQDVRSAWAADRLARQNLHRHKSQILSLSRSSVRRMEVAVALGIASETELLQARREALTAEQEGVRLHLELALAGLRLERALGRPLEASPVGD